LVFTVNGFRKARYAAKLTQQEAAKRIGVDLRTISAWEKDENVPRDKNVEKAAEVYGCTVDELLKKDDA